MNARAIAAKLLTKIVKDKQFIDFAMQNYVAYGNLPAREQSFVAACLYTTLRYLGEIDHLINRHLKKSGVKDKSTFMLLRVAVGEVLYMQTPNYAVVNEYVELAGDYKPLVNAILQRIIKNQNSTLDKVDKVTINYPKWLLGSWAKAYGKQAAHNIAAIMLQEPYMDLYYKDSGLQRQDKVTDVTKLEGFTEGEFWVQDYSSVQSVLGLGDIKGKTILDLCAAPGGKTSLFCHLGADVTAVDISENRLNRLRQNLDRLNFSAKVMQADIGNLNLPDKYDIVFLDAPCSATGTIRKHPELKHVKTHNDVLELASTQAQLLIAASKWVAAGGILAYATCSLQYEEGEGQIKKFIAVNPQFKILHEQRILPTDNNGATGFYYCYLYSN